MSALVPVVLNEVFGPTIQGEGPSAGRRAVFVRLARCNLDCRWCDTPYTWDWHGKNGTAYDPKIEAVQTTVTDVLDQLDDLPGDLPGLVVITGGEPLLQPAAVSSLAAALTSRGANVEIETNATRPLLAAHARVSYNLSPKLDHSGVNPKHAYNWEVWHEAARRPDCRWKFVCQTVDDVADVEHLATIHKLQRDQVWIMPEGRAATVVSATLADLADAAVTAGFNLSPRLHVTAWEDTRGR